MKFLRIMQLCAAGWGLICTMRDGEVASLPPGCRSTFGVALPWAGLICPFGAHRVHLIHSLIIIDRVHLTHRLAIRPSACASVTSSGKVMPPWLTKCEISSAVLSTEGRTG